MMDLESARNRLDSYDSDTLEFIYTTHHNRQLRRLAREILNERD